MIMSNIAKVSENGSHYVAGCAGVSLVSLVALVALVALWSWWSLRTSRTGVSVLARLTLRSLLTLRSSQSSRSLRTSRSLWPYVFVVDDLTGDEFVTVLTAHHQISVINARTGDLVFNLGPPGSLRFLRRVKGYRVNISQFRISDNINVRNDNCPDHSARHVLPNSPCPPIT